MLFWILRVLSNHVRMWHIRCQAKLSQAPNFLLLSHLMTYPFCSAHHPRAHTGLGPAAWYPHSRGMDALLHSVTHEWWCESAVWEREESWVRACDTDWSWAFVMCLWCGGRDHMAGLWPRFFSAPESRKSCPVSSSDTAPGRKLTHSSDSYWMLAMAVHSPNLKSTVFSSKHGTGLWEQGSHLDSAAHLHWNLGKVTSLQASVSSYVNSKVLGQMPSKSPFRNVEPPRILKTV